jgi:hypothetical protein
MFEVAEKVKELKGSRVQGLGQKFFLKTSNLMGLHSSRVKYKIASYKPRRY